jgi:hypothetical protein
MYAQNPYVSSFADDTKCIICQGEMGESAEVICSLTCNDLYVRELYADPFEMEADCYDV